MSGKVSNNSIEEKVNSALDKLDKIQAELNEIFINRDIIIKLSIISLIAQENIVLLGPPGTAKSMLAREICRRITGADFFERLLTKFTDETELFESGLSIIEKEKDIKDGKIKETSIKKSSKNMLPEKHIAFLDEIFKGTSAILNALLTLINEKKYFTSDGKAIDSNLITVFAASNERPAQDSGLEALYDRFLIRYHVGYLGEEDFIKLLKMKPLDINKEPEVKVSLDDLRVLNSHLNAVLIPDEIYDFISEMIKKVKKEENELGIISPSDRRMKNSLKLIKAHALLYRRMVVEKRDVTEVYSFVLLDTTPGNSANLKDNQEKLSTFISKIGSIYLQEFEEYENSIDNKEKEMEELVINIRAANTEKKTVQEKELIKNYFNENIKFVAEIDTYIKKADEILSCQLEMNEKNQLRLFKERLENMKKDCEECLFEFTKRLRIISN